MTEENKNVNNSKKDSDSKVANTKVDKGATVMPPINGVTDKKVVKSVTLTKAIIGGAVVLLIGLGSGLAIGHSTSSASGGTTLLGGSQALVTADGTRLTADDFIPLLGATSQDKVLVQQKVVGTIFENNHPNLVTNAEVTKQMNTIKSEYGSSFSSAIEQAGFTEKTFREYTKQSLIMKKFVESKVNVSDEKVKQEFKTFVPKQKVKIASFSTKEDAMAYQKDPNATKYKGNAQQITLGTNSNEHELSDQILQAAYKVKEGKTSDVLKEAGSSSTVYVVLQGVKHVDRGTDWKKYKQDITDYLKTQKTTDVAFSAKTIKAELKRLGTSYSNKHIQDVVKDAFSSQVGASTDTGTTPDSQTETQDSSDSQSDTQSEDSSSSSASSVSSSSSSSSSSSASSSSAQNSVSSSK